MGTLFGTDIGPQCACSSRIYAYLVSGYTVLDEDEVGVEVLPSIAHRHTIQVRCVSCGALTEYDCRGPAPVGVEAVRKTHQQRRAEEGGCTSRAPWGCGCLPARRAYPAGPFYPDAPNCKT